jgi:hypothetical protein
LFFAEALSRWSESFDVAQESLDPGLRFFSGTACKEARPRIKSGATALFAFQPKMIAIWPSGGNSRCAQAINSC